MDVKVGDSIKLWLPGESPWGEVLEVKGPYVKARIDNRLIPEWTPDERKRIFGFDKPSQHNYTHNSIEWFEYENGVWVPLKVERQVG